MYCHYEIILSLNFALNTKQQEMCNSNDSQQGIQHLVNAADFLVLYVYVHLLFPFLRLTGIHWADECFCAFYCHKKYQPSPRNCGPEQLCSSSAGLTSGCQQNQSVIGTLCLDML